MQQLKNSIATLVLWLCTFFTIERLHEPMNIASFVYVLGAILALVVLLLPRITNHTQLTLFAVSVVLLFVLKRLLGYPSLGTALPITVTESLAIGLTIFLMGRVNQSVREFQQAALKIAGASEFGQSSDFDQGQSEIYRDLRRARSFQRPLALMTVTPELKGNERVLDGIVEEIYRNSTRQYLRGQIADLLLHATDGCATVVGRDDHLVVSLPEVEADRAKEILQKMRDVVRDQLEIELTVGVAAFPDEELTLTGLLDRAEGEMRKDVADVIPVTHDELSSVDGLSSVAAMVGRVPR